jgi:hypothetical protein
MRRRIGFQPIRRDTSEHVPAYCEKMAKPVFIEMSTWNSLRSDLPRIDLMPEAPHMSREAPPARRALDLLSIGAIVRNERRRRSMTQADLALASGVSKSRIEAIESGRCRDAGFVLVSAILGALDLSLHISGLAPVQIE